MTPAEAVRLLTEAARRDDDVRWMLAGMTDRLGVDIYGYAEAHPEEIVELAETTLDLLDQNPPGLGAP